MVRPVSLMAMLVASLLTPTSFGLTLGFIQAELEVTRAAYVEVEDPGAAGLPAVGDTLDFLFTFESDAKERTQLLPFLWQTVQPLYDIDLRTRGLGANDRFAALADSFVPTNDSTIQYTVNSSGSVGLGVFPYGMTDPVVFLEPEFEFNVSGLTTAVDPATFMITQLPGDVTPQVTDGTIIGRFTFRSREFAGDFDAFVEADVTALRFLPEIVVEPAGGDFNGDGRVDNGDLNLLLGSWGASSVPAEWINSFEAPVDNGELNELLGDWGFGVPAAAPEPLSALMAAIAASLGATRRNTRLTRSP